MSKAAYLNEVSMKNKKQSQASQERAKRMQREEDLRKQRELLQHHEMHKRKEQESRRQKLQQKAQQKREEYWQNWSKETWLAQVKEQELVQIEDTHEEQQEQQQHQDEQQQQEQPQEQDSADFVMHHGHLAGGNDIAEEEMTVDDARHRCASLPGCRGFTFEGSPGPEPVTIYFKSEWDFHEGSPWTSYQFQPALENSSPVPLEQPAAEQPAAEQPAAEQPAVEQTLEEPEVRGKSNSVMVYILGLMIVLVLLVLVGKRPNLLQRTLARELRSAFIPLPGAGGGNAAAGACLNKMFDISESEEGKEFAEDQDEWHQWLSDNVSKPKASQEVARLAHRSPATRKTEVESIYV